MSRHHRIRRHALVALCLLGAAMAAATTGTAGADPLGPDSITSPFSADSVGGYASLVLDADGNPLISYYDATNDNVEILACTNPDCSGAQNPQSPNTSGTGGWFTSLALAPDGNPVIAYYD